ncbi:hypothetical protein SAMN02745165_02889 [Malonomonas rubra DSM 5091]|uniref:Uncharacterized protein n=1 Tax=Malonomonas rubra DSM 5091 TaxID=1122189 RepID=A0A1M6L6P0_MALRU|nr:hypothetical protein [Malonomonas rubra]SHJ66784.1 hypothetical protein SAMN02745165_02889 [Malonomonas rubra DSM 5091]
MFDRDKIATLINKRVNRVLQYAEASLPQSQFRAFRKLVLDEFGDNGMAKDLNKMGRNGQE